MRKSLFSAVLLTGLLLLARAHAQNFAPPQAPGAAALSPAVEPVTARVGLTAQTGDYFNLQKKIYRWNDKTHFVLVYIAPAAYLRDWQPVNVQVAKDAFAEWQHALDNRLIFIFMNDPSTADVVVNWWYTTQPGFEKGACGVNMVKTWGKFIQSNDVYISLHGLQGETWTPAQLHTIALHEIGHMIGIREHSDNPNDVMYAEALEQQHLSARDINTMKLIYAHKADYANPEGYHLSNFDAFKKTHKGGFWLPIIVPIPL